MWGTSMIYFRTGKALRNFSIYTQFKTYLAKSDLKKGRVRREFSHLLKIIARDCERHEIRIAVISRIITDEKRQGRMSSEIPSVPHFWVRDFGRLDALRGFDAGHLR
jgi:hypothetical protein